MPRSRTGIALAEHAEAVLADDPRWELVTPAQLGIVTFRPSFPALPSELAGARACPRSHSPTASAT